MVNKLILEAQSGGLFIEYNLNEYAWSRCHLITRTSSRYIGAETAHVIAKRLLAWLQKEKLGKRLCRLYVVVV
jgi:hypothetical protein